MQQKARGEPHDPEPCGNQDDKAKESVTVTFVTSNLFLQSVFLLNQSIGTFPLYAGISSAVSC